MSFSASSKMAENARYIVTFPIYISTEVKCYAPK
jgi:hypothetical protein